MPSPHKTLNLSHDVVSLYFNITKSNNIHNSYFWPKCFYLNGSVTKLICVFQTDAVTPHHLEREAATQLHQNT